MEMCSFIRCSSYSNVYSVILKTRNFLMNQVLVAEQLFGAQAMEYVTH